MRNLLLSSLIILTLAGCHFGHYGRLKEAVDPELKAEMTEHPPKPIFGDNFNSFLFKTNISVYGKDFSGLLVTKQMKPKDYRVIFTTELGMKLFDFQFQDTAFTLHYCVPQFNKPALLKTIQQDIEVLLMNNLEGKPTKRFLDEKAQLQVYRVDMGRRHNYYFREPASRNIVRIEQAKKRRKKTTFTLSGYESSIPSNIVIRHHDIRLRIELNLLKK